MQVWIDCESGHENVLVTKHSSYAGLCSLDDDAANPGAGVIRARIGRLSICQGPNFIGGGWLS